MQNKLLSTNLNQILEECSALNAIALLIVDRAPKCSNFQIFSSTFWYFKHLKLNDKCCACCWHDQPILTIGKVFPKNICRSHSSPAGVFHFNVCVVFPCCLEPVFTRDRPFSMSLLLFVYSHWWSLMLILLSIMFYIRTGGCCETRRNFWLNSTPWCWRWGLCPTYSIIGSRGR